MPVLNTDESTPWPSEIQEWYPEAEDLISYTLDEASTGMPLHDQAAVDQQAARWAEEWQTNADYRDLPPIGGLLRSI